MRRACWALLLCVLTACTSTRLATESVNPAYKGSVYDNILVIGVGKFEESRRYYEDALVKQLNKGGTAAVPSYTLFPSASGLKRETVEPVVREKGFDGVIVTHFLAEVPFDAYQGRGVDTDYYMSRYGAARAYVNDLQSGSSEHARIYISTNLFDVGTGKSVWTASSETSNPGSNRKVVNSVAPLVASSLRDKGLIR